MDDSVCELWPGRNFQTSKRYVCNFFIFFGPMEIKSVPRPGLLPVRQGSWASLGPHLPPSVTACSRWRYAPTFARLLLLPHVYMFTWRNSTCLHATCLHAVQSCHMGHSSVRVYYSNGLAPPRPPTPSWVLGEQRQRQITTARQQESSH